MILFAHSSRNAAPLVQPASMKRRRAWLLTTTIGVVLCAARGARLHIQRQQHARNQHLIDALRQADTATALALVNAGADPNTRLFPTAYTCAQNLLPHPLPRAPLQPAQEGTDRPDACLRGPLEPAGGRRSPRWFAWRKTSLCYKPCWRIARADVNATTAGNLTALHFALIRQRVDTVQLLLRHGADVNAQDDYGRTPLPVGGETGHGGRGASLARTRRKPECARFAPAWTALHYAVVSSSSQHIIPELLAHGADPDLRNDFGETPLELAGWAMPDELRLLMQSTSVGARLRQAMQKRLCLDVDE